jgi:hypothetical protein
VGVVGPEPAAGGPDDLTAGRSDVRNESIYMGAVILRKNSSRKNRIPVDGVHPVIYDSKMYMSFAR